MDTKYVKPQAIVIPDKVVGFIEKGTFTGSRVLENGRSAKVTVNDYVANGVLTDPPDIDSPILVGSVIREDTHYSEDNRARLIVPGVRGRTYESIEYVDSYFKGNIAGTPPKA